jgi:photosystem II stability/assembly factor-like uncharacterized protein
MVSSCRKEQTSLITHQIETGTLYDLHDVFFVNDSVGYACGGSRYAIGVVLKTTNRGNTWSSADSIIPKAAYCTFFKNESEGFVAGFDSYMANTSDGGNSYSTTIGNYAPIYDIAFTDADHGVRVSGDGGRQGFIAHTNDGGASWTETSYPYTLRAVSYASANTIFVSGYGVLYKSTDGARTFQPTYARGDFFVALDFPSVNVGYLAGYQGLILKTDDGGASFKKVMAGNAPFSKREHLEAIKFWDENTGYVCGDNGIMYKTENGGDSWRIVKQFTSVNLRSIHLFSATSGIVVGDEGKVFLFRE